METTLNSLVGLIRVYREKNTKLSNKEKTHCLLSKLSVNAKWLDLHDPMIVIPLQSENFVR
jgi:hypothetical protein